MTQAGGFFLEKSVAAYLQGNLGSLSGAERRIARALLADYPSAGLGTVQSLAEAAGVSSPSVSRFVKSLGLQNFPALQSVLREEVRRFTSGPLGRVSEHEVGSPSALLVSRAQRLTERVMSTLAAIPDADLEAAIDLLCDQRRRVVITGGRYSRTLAEYLYLHLEQFRPKVRFLDQPVGRDLGHLLDIGRRDVYVLYDFRRYDETTCRIAELAHSYGASVLLMTDDQLSPAAVHAEVVLPTNIDSPSRFDSWVAPLTMTEMLLLQVYERLEDTARKRMVMWEALRVPGHTTATRTSSPSSHL